MFDDVHTCQVTSTAMPKKWTSVRVTLDQATELERARVALGWYQDPTGKRKEPSRGDTIALLVECLRWLNALDSDRVRTIANDH